MTNDEFGGLPKIRHSSFELFVIIISRHGHTMAPLGSLHPQQTRT
jgi:hypothetical protein